MQKNKNKTHAKQRTFEVYKDYLKGLSRHEITQKFSKKWGTTVRSVDNYIKYAKEMVQEQIEVSAGIEFEKNQARLEDLYRRLYDDENYYHCLQVIQSMNKMCGLNKEKEGLSITDPVKIELTEEDRMSVEQLKKVYKQSNEDK